MGAMNVWSIVHFVKVLCVYENLGIVYLFPFIYNRNAIARPTTQAVSENTSEPSTQWDRMVMGMT